MCQASSFQGPREGAEGTPVRPAAAWAEPARDPVTPRAASPPARGWVKGGSGYDEALELDLEDSEAASVSTRPEEDDALSALPPARLREVHQLFRKSSVQASLKAALVHLYNCVIAEYRSCPGTFRKASDKACGAAKKDAGGPGGSRRGHG